MGLWPAICYADATCVKTCQKLSFVREKYNSHWLYSNIEIQITKSTVSRKTLAAGASGLVVHGKNVMLERSPPEIWVSVLLLAVFLAVYMDQDIAHRKPDTAYLPTASARPYFDARYKSGSNMALMGTGATLKVKPPWTFCAHLNLR